MTFSPVKKVLMKERCGSLERIFAVVHLHGDSFKAIELDLSSIEVD